MGNGGCGCAVLQPGGLVNESMEGNEDLIPNPPYLFSGGVVAVLLIGLAGVVAVARLVDLVVEPENH